VRDGDATGTHRRAGGEMQNGVAIAIAISGLLVGAIVFLIVVSL
jgi:hypothetical protein